MPARISEFSEFSADAAGSGKIRLGLHLISAISDQILRTRRLGKGKTIVANEIQ